MDWVPNAVVMVSAAYVVVTLIRYRGIYQERAYDTQQLLDCCGEMNEQITVESGLAESDRNELAVERKRRSEAPAERGERTDFAGDGAVRKNSSSTTTREPRAVAEADGDV